MSQKYLIEVWKRSSTSPVSFRGVVKSNIKTLCDARAFAKKEISRVGDNITLRICAVGANGRRQMIGDVTKGLFGVCWAPFGDTKYRRYHLNNDGSLGDGFN